jgi:hypothetical protein
MPFKEWSTADVVRHLKSLGFGQYTQEFQLNEITGLHLPLLTEEHLREMGVSSVGHRILILRRFSDIVNGLDIREPVSVPPTRPARTNDAPKSPIRKAEPIAPEKSKPAIIPMKNQEVHFDRCNPASSSSDESDSSIQFAHPKAPPKHGAWFPPQKRVEAPKPPTKKPDSALPTVIAKKPDVPLDSNVWKKPDQSVTVNPPKKFEAPVAVGKKQENRFETCHSGDSSSQASGSDKPIRRQVLNAKPETKRSGTETLSARATNDSTPIEAENGRVTCQYCGRQLQPDAAKRHIPVCARFNAGRTAKR